MTVERKARTVDRARGSRAFSTGDAQASERLFPSCQEAQEEAHAAPENPAHRRRRQRQRQRERERTVDDAQTLGVGRRHQRRLARHRCGGGGCAAARRRPPRRRGAGAAAPLHQRREAEDGGAEDDGVRALVERGTRQPRQRVLPAVQHPVAAAVALGVRRLGCRASHWYASASVAGVVRRRACALSPDPQWRWLHVLPTVGGYPFTSSPPRTSSEPSKHDLTFAQERARTGR